MADKNYKLTFELSDGTSKAVQFTAPQGEAGVDGYTPVRGTDYWTAADQEAIVQQVIIALGTPVFGTVDADNNIILTGELVEGTYILKYEDAEGNVAEIGTVTVGNSGETDEPTYTNWIPLSTEVDGVTLYNGGLGYKENTRWSASGGGDVSAEGITVSGYIPVSYGDIIRIKNIRMNKNDTEANVCTVSVFDELGSGEAANYSDLTNYWSAVWDDDGNLLQFTINNQNTKYIRLNTSYIGSDSILTINEEIADSGAEDMGESGSIELTWSNGVKLDKDTGVEGSGDGYAASQHIDLVDGYTYTFNQSNAYGGVNICYYDSDGNGLGYELLWDSTNGTFSKELTPVDGAVTFRVRLYHGNDDLLTGNYYSVTYEKIAETYTNVLPLAINSDGSAYNGGQGWKTGYRLNSSSVESANEGMEVTGFISVKQGDIVRFANIQWPVNSGVSANKCYVSLFASDFSPVTSNSSDQCFIREIDGRLDGVVGTDSEGNLNEFAINSEIFENVADWNEVAYMRVSSYEITSDSIITINEEITENKTAYTNMIPVSTDTDGSVFNGTGFKNGYRLNSSGTIAEYTEYPMVVSGFIPCKAGDTIRLQNITWQAGVDSKNNQRIACYDASKNYLNQGNVGTIAEISTTVRDENNVVQQFTLGSDGYSFDPTNAAFIRISATYIGTDSILTVNEEIV